MDKFGYILIYLQILVDYWSPTSVSSNSSTYTYKGTLISQERLLTSQDEELKNEFLESQLRNDNDEGELLDWLSSKRRIKKKITLPKEKPQLVKDYENLEVVKEFNIPIINIREKFRIKAWDKISIFHSNWV